MDLINCYLLISFKNGGIRVPWTLKASPWFDLILWSFTSTHCIMINSLAYVLSKEIAEKSSPVCDLCSYLKLCRNNYCL